MATDNTSSAHLPNKLYDFKSPKIATFELENGNSHYCAFTLNKKKFGTVRQCQLMHQLLYSILFKIGVRNSDVVSSKHNPLTPSELLELPRVDGVSSQAWLYMKGRWRLKILEHRREKYYLRLQQQGVGRGLVGQEEGHASGIPQRQPTIVDESGGNHVSYSMIDPDIDKFVDDLNRLENMLLPSGSDLGVFIETWIF